MKREWISCGMGALLTLASGATSVRAQTWEPLGTLPTGGAARQYAAGVNHNGILYAIGGTPWQNGGDQDGSVHRYQNGVWTAVAPVGGEGPIISEAAGVDALGRVVVYGGFIMGDDGAGPDRVYDPIEGPTDAIAGRPVPDTAIGYFAWAADDLHRLYGFGGGPGAGGPNSGYCDRYDALSDTWTVLAPLPTPVADACAAYDGDGHMLVIGGIDAAGAARLANVAQYDIVSDTWSDVAVPDFPVAISGARAVLGADGRVYVIGGETGPIGSGITQTAVYKLEPATNMWVAADSLTTARKWFACVLGSDDYIYAIGGDNDSGGTDTFERLFTPRCAEISGPDDQLAFAGSVAGFTVTAGGAAPFTYQWRRDGVDLLDGPTGTGSIVSGATTPTLTVAYPGADDAGVYDVVVSNACGAVASASATLTLQQPPDAPASWAARNIHPAWADGSSRATGLAGGTAGGWAIRSTLLPDGRVLDLSHPIAWDTTTPVPIDITPQGSIGGEILDGAGNLLVGWFWHTFSCPPWTCGWQSAGYWEADTFVFDETHMSGAEYDHAVATDGARLVSNAAFEYTEGNYTFRPYLWTPPQSVASLDPGTAIARATVNAIDGNHQYGSVLPSIGGTWRAAMWSGTGASMVEVHPAGYTDSHIVAAGDGQAVGQVEDGGGARAALWAGGSAAAIELHQPGWTSSIVAATHGGVQAGAVGGRAALWFGSADSYVDLHPFVPPGFTSSSAEDVRVATDGHITVVGHGYNSNTGQQEALLWQGIRRLGDCDDDGDIDLADYECFAACLEGPGATSTTSGCLDFDFDQDQDVDLADFARFAAEFGT